MNDVKIILFVNIEYYKRVRNNDKKSQRELNFLHDAPYLAHPKLRKERKHISYFCLMND
jgi:hypothetical protein